MHRYPNNGPGRPSTYFEHCTIAETTNQFSFIGPRENRTNETRRALNFDLNRIPGPVFQNETE
jgi:hypothetical protein